LSVAYCRPTYVFNTNADIEKVLNTIIQEFVSDLNKNTDTFKEFHKVV